MILNLIFGCASSYEMAVVRQMRCVRIGLMNYDSWHGRLPGVNGNSWRFSGSTKFSTVSWRGVVLESIEGLGSPKGGSAISRQELEDSIDNAGRRAFERDDMIICLNPLIQGHALSSLPPKMVMAFFVKKHEASWYEDQNVDTGELYETIGSNHLALLFGDGTVGFSGAAPRTFLEQIFTLEGARNIVADDFIRYGFSIHDAK